MAGRITRLWAPALLLAGLIGLATWGPGLWQSLIGPAADARQILFGYLLPSAVWLAGAWGLVRLADVFLWDTVARRLGWPVPRLLRDTLALLIVFGAAGGILADVFERSLTGFLAASSAVAVIVAFALRNVILDIFTGLAINLDRSYQIGDWIEVHNRDFKEPVYGRVVDINWRTTRIETQDARTVVIPNNVMSTTMTTNYSLPDHVARFEVVVPLDFSVPTGRAIRLLEGGAMAAISPDGALERPAPNAIVGAISERGIEYRVRYWIRMGQVAPSRAKGTVLRAIVDQMAAAGIEPALPKEDVYYARMPAHTRDWNDGAARLALLRKVELFDHSLEETELIELAGRMALRAYRAGETLTRQGGRGRSMFVLAEGAAEVLVRPSDGGAERRVARLRAGQPFGEMALLTGGPRSSTVRALSDVLAFEIRHQHLAPLLESRPELAGALSWLVAERRLRTSQALHAGPAMAGSQDPRRLSQQILDRMRALFQGGSGEGGSG